MTDFTGSGGNDIFVGSESTDTALGGGGSDTLLGNGGSDTLAGEDGGDYLEGGEGDDTLYSGFRTLAYNAPYYGNPWTAPTLDTGADVDTLLGGNGSDTFFAGYGDNVDGGIGGSDSLYISLMGATSGVVVDFSQASVTIGGGTITGIENVNWVQGSNFDDDITMGSGNGYSSFAPVFGMGGNDRLVAGYYTGTLFGGDGNDVVDGRGSQYLQLVDGGAGDDTLYTNSNTFGTASGGDGNDSIYAHGTINGDAGNDTIYIQQSYYAGQVRGGAGDDIIYAPTNQAVGNVFGDDGADTLHGGNGADILDGGAGNDTIDGGAQSILGQYSGDVAVYSGNVADYSVALDAGTGVVTITDLRPGSPDGIDQLSNIEILKFANGTYSVAAVLSGQATGIQNFVGTAADDSYQGSEDNNTAIGNGGIDSFYGNGGSDTLQGNEGADYLNGGAGSDTLYSGSLSPTFSAPYYGNTWTAPVLDTGSDVDTLVGGDGSDTIFAGYGDNVDGGADADNLYISFLGALSGVTVDFRLGTNIVGGGTITGIESISWVQGSDFDDDITMGSGSGAGASTPVFGMDGNDRLIAGYYTGYMDGGDGNDVVDGRNSQYLQSVLGGAGDDTLYTSSNGFGAANGGDGHDTIYAHGTINGDAGNDTIYIQQSYYAGQVHGGDGDDIIYAPTNQAVTAVFGDAGNDQLYGSNLADTLDGGAGDDRLNGGAGINSLIGGAGNDRLIVMAGADGTVVNGGADFDTLAVTGAVTIGGAMIGIEAIELNAANLTLSGSQFNTGLAANAQIGGTGSVTVNMQPNFAYSGGQLQLLAGSSVSFTINGSASSDAIKVNLNASHTINAGNGADQIRGSQLIDTINGGADNDKIIGLGGADVLTGGSGNDQFRYFGQNDSGTGANADRITDFTIGGDKLNFFLIDADAALEGDQEFSFIGTDAFAATGTGQIRYTNSGTDLLVQADVNGDGVVDMEIILQGLNGDTLTAGDFIL
jgi:Ca2+-binding RTX toxin-like protein